MGDDISIELKEYLYETCDYSPLVINGLSVGDLYRLVRFKNEEKAEYFKIRLRECGYII